ncbi:subtype B tannase [Actinoplanes sp. RD1]|uniref:subtype B tannase n=1 Tax=Actinoplanes sp. RD1 TaxID=3064538 RepID=UPI0027422E1B|nr:subtype B tannase [Actinoplanes sp. RD1]
MKRRTVLTGLAAAAGAAAGLGLPATARAAGPAPFDLDAYEVLETTIATASGDRVVRYHFWRAVPYVAAPVDVRYQSLNISVPVKIDGRAVDARQAPILFATAVAGYLPSSVADATGIGGGATSSPPPGTDDPGETPEPAPEQPREVSTAELALAAGYVVVEPGARGRTLVDEAGVHHGTAPAAIVDLKAAVRYLRANKGRVPGDPDRIVATGAGAGGGLSALLGASGDSPLYEPYLRRLGAAAASDAVFAAAAHSPVTDLEHADLAYEWCWGDLPTETGETVDPDVTQDLRMGFADHLAELDLTGRDGFGPLTAATYDDYLLRAYLRPAAAAYVNGLPEGDRPAALDASPVLADPAFTWSAFQQHVGSRRKGAPAFDALDLSAPENNEFGTGTIPARHFTTYSLRRASGNEYARLDADLDAKLTLMNPMPFLTARHAGRARHWWLRTGTRDTETSLTTMTNLATAAENAGDDVDARMYWDAGHGADEDAPAFLTWLAGVTGYPQR